MKISLTWSAAHDYISDVRISERLTWYAEFRTHRDTSVARRSNTGSSRALRTWAGHTLSHTHSSSTRVSLRST
jgi:hypothetical protein